MKNNKSFIIIIIFAALGAYLGTSFYKSNNNNPKDKVNSKNEIIGIWKNKNTGFVYNYQNETLIISDNNDDIFLILKYMITNSSLIGIDSNNDFYSNAMLISKNKNKLALINDEGKVIYDKVNSEELKYNIVKDEKEVVGLWVNELESISYGYSFFDDGSVVMLIGSKPVNTVFKYYISNDIFYTVKDNKVHTEGFPLILLKNQLYMFGDAKKPLIKMMDN
ncbi:hypothetical protein R4K48_07760 [Brachyspira pulli]|uniref:hypothetical protein n=1 Tax=Brachyspira TaxID=29521 RepID=UPI00037E2D76|nr:hypothetical protein [Brachyspira innocens]